MTGGAVECGGCPSSLPTDTAAAGVGDAVAGHLAPPKCIATDMMTFDAKNPNIDEHTRCPCSGM